MSLITERYLLQIEETLALLQRRQPCSVIFAEFPPSHETVVSMFERTSNTIYFNMDLIENISEEELVGLLIHEGRHAYQWFQVTNPDSRLEKQEVIAKWQSEFDNYTQPKSNGFEREYVEQELEIDAVAFTKIQLDKLDMGNLIVPKEISSRVEARIKEIKTSIIK